MMPITVIIISYARGPRYEIAPTVPSAARALTLPGEIQDSVPGGRCAQKC